MTDRQWENFIHAVREIVEEGTQHPDNWRAVKADLDARLKESDDYHVSEFFSWYGIDTDTETEKENN